ncbi:WD repeat-containing protein 60 isoform X3 [Gouania willdenowi]|uniref:WD repeat-containing protein 60 isoform X3 n=1 Tax=Gouania willdenowi TaxID=441366 RepID=UPI001055D51D|nr:WD repeat-containing protein 60 isoform X3 [Gouania willdenowi]
MRVAGNSSWRRHLGKINGFSEPEKDPKRPKEMHSDRDSEHVDNSVRKRGDHEKKHRGGESTERRHRDIEHDVKKEGENTRGRRDEDGGNAGRGKESSQDRRRDKESDRQKRIDRYEIEKKYVDDHRENRDRRRDREEHHRDREKETHRDSKKERTKGSDRREDREKREERHRDREQMERENKREKERRRHERSGEGRRDEAGKHHREQRDPQTERERHQNEEDRRDGGQKRHEDRKDSDRRQRDFSDERKHKEERERRHKERRHHDERQGLKGSGEEVRHHGDDRERRDKDRKHRDEKDTERKNQERRGKEEEEAEGKHKHRKHGEEDDAQRKHRERKHKEEEEEEEVKRNHQDGTSAKTSATDNVMEAEEVFSENWRHDVKDKEDTEESLANDEESAEQEYEDDFEKVDYEDDFEDMDEEEEEEEEPLHPEEDEKKEEISPQRKKEIEAVQRAIEEENERVGTTQIRPRRNREEEEESQKGSTGSELNQRKVSLKGRFMDFVAAKKREVNKQVATKQKKRSTELLRLIDLDFSQTFSLLELQPVNEYDMYIRNFGTANTKQAYVQCNEDNADRDIQTEEVETCEKWTQHPPERNRACGDPNLSQEVQDTARNAINFDSKRLTSFLRSASQVMVVLLEDDRAERNSLRKLKTHADTLSFSDGSLQLNTTLPFLHGRHISLVHFSQVQRHTMMSVHMRMSKAGATLFDSCTVICIWNIWEPSRPQKILVYESEVQCCCFSPGKATLVFAGTSVGSVVLWDLREHASDHYSSIIEGEEWNFRQPTFSTDAVLACSGHSSCVTSVEVLPSSVIGGQRLEVPLLSSEDSSGLSFQLASLDENGVLNFWVVVELSKGDEAGSLTDLGLRPGGKVKLLHSARLQTAESPSPRDAVKTGPIQTMLFKFLPTDSSHFFIGTNMGAVHHRTSHGLKARPKSYRFQEVEVRPVDVSSLHFSPFKPHLFLVGCGDGSVRLHTVGREQPVAQWTNSTAGEPVVSLQWSNTRPSVFCVLDAASNIHIWDLSKNDAEPVFTERVHTDRVTAMAVFGDSSSQTYSGSALAHASGKIVLQYFTGNLSVSSSADEEKLENLMTEAF